MSSTMFSLSLIIILIIRPVVSDSFKMRNKGTVCTTRQCQDVSEMLQNTMNPAVAPCRDFYEYSCGKFANNYVPHPQTRWPYYDTVKDTAQKKVIGYLESPLDNRDGPLIKWAKYQFKACMDTRRLNEVGVKPLSDKMMECGGRTICRIGPIGLPKKWHEAHDLYNRLMGKGGLFTIGVKYIPDFHQNVIVLDITEDLFVHTRGSLQPPDIKKYTKFLNDISTETCKLYRTTSLTVADLGAIQKVIQFRESLTKIKGTSRETRQSMISIQRLQDETNRHMCKKPVDWLDLVSSTFQSVKSAGVNNSTMIFIENIHVLLAYLNVINGTPEEVIIDHLHFYFLENYISYSNMKMYKLYQGMHTKVLPPRSTACVSDRVLRRVSNFIHVQNFLPKNTMSMAEKVVQGVQRTLQDQISRTRWMSTYTKHKAADNVDMIYHFLEYEDWDKDMNNVTAHYSTLPISDDYMRNTFNFDSFSYSKKLSLLETQPNPDTKQKKEELRTSSLNAPDHSTRTDQKSITESMLLLQLPSFGAELPQAINYAGYGASNGELLADVGNSIGREHSESAYNRWDNKSIDKYMDRWVFYASMIDKYVPKEFAAAGVRGNVIMHWHIAHATTQYMGLVAAYEAYRKNKSVNNRWSKLIDLDDIDGDKLFFVAYALNRCEAINVQEFASAMNLSNKNVDLPARLTVNVALSNMQAFSDTFACKQNDPMNPFAKLQFYSELIGREKRTK